MIGKVINDKYRIIELIGTGGMSDVYKAVDVKTGEYAAIKFLKDDTKDNPTYVRRFELEAQAGMNLNHPNIVKLLDASQFEGRQYIVFEYVNGPTLKSYIEKHGVFAPRMAVNIVGNILDAIGYAHGKGIIHRDVKPQNVMIMANGTVKLADFGIARHVNASTKSLTSNALGSVHYMSPEQAAGKEITCQTDLYSVGIILFEMLTGTLPFNNANNVTVALMHINEKVKAPQEVNPGISHALNAVVLKATAKDMNKRYKSAAEMKNDLFRALREPDGTFADIPDDPDENENGDENAENTVVHKTILGLNRGVFILTVSLAALLVVMIGAFMIIRSSYNPTVTVPDLIDKTIEQAEAALGDDLRITVLRESSDKNPGHIISQDPASGKRLSKGSAVTVTVSIGSENTVSPNLNGKLLSEACRMLQEKGLNVSSVVYGSDTDAEPGTVYAQTPKADEEVKLGEKYTLYIAGKPANTAEMPKVTDMSIKKAVDKLNEAGFMHIIVRTETSGGKEGNIIAQGMDAGLVIDTDTAILLTMCTGETGKASYDGAKNVTLEHESYIMVTIDTKAGYELVAFTGVRTSGTVTVSYTAHAKTAGTYDCIIYVDGYEYTRTSVNLSE